MSESVLTEGSLVAASYKSGTYIGEVIETRGANKLLVKIAAVLEHPLQGDLHHPYRVDAARFFPRKALADGEVALIPVSEVQNYNGEVPNYSDSLREALVRHESELKARGDEYAKLALIALEEVKKEYTFM